MEERDLELEFYEKKQKYMQLKKAALFPEWMSHEAKATVKELLKEDEKGIYVAWRRVINASAAKLVKFGMDQAFIDGYKEDLFEVLNEGWMGLATPVLTEMGRAKGGFPISCYSVSVGDSISEIFSTLAETAKMTQNTGGVGVYMGHVRASNSKTSSGSIASGPVSFCKNYDITAKTVAQGPRRGSFAFYLPIWHADVRKLLLSKDHTQGDSRRWLDSNIGVTIPDWWMREMLNGDKDKKDLFTDIILTRKMCGTPYLFFTDNVNKANPPAYVNNGLMVETSNICTEIMLFTDSMHSFVCCLSSLNLDKYDIWKNHRSKNLGLSVPYIGTIFLDTVLEEFIEKASLVPEMSKAVRSAVKGRALGLGSMGLASLYQKRNLAWYEPECYKLNIEVHKLINTESKKASAWMAKTFGEPEWCKGTGMRNSHTIAIAPTRTNSSICGSVSMGIEPIESNTYAAKQDKGTFIRRNPNLEYLLKTKYKKNSPEVWEQISLANGSVSNLDFLDKHDKQVYRTAREIDQFDLLKQAADRQPFIDQGQALNLFVDTYGNEQYLVELHTAAWMLGLKSIYYLRTKSKQTLTTLNYIITKKGCGWCDKLKAELDERGLAYLEISLSEAKRKGLWKQSYKTTPQLFFDGIRVGGYNDYMDKYVHGNMGMATHGLLDGAFRESEECTACEG